MVDLTYYRKWAKIHPNFMTPHIMKLIECDPYVIEISDGTDFNRKQIFGVSVFKMCGSTFENMSLTRDDLSKMCRTPQEVRRQIEYVKAELAKLSFLLIGIEDKHDVYQDSKTMQIWHYSGKSKTDWINPLMWEKVK